MDCRNWSVTWAGGLTELVRHPGRRTVDGVDKQQRARSRASGAESNPTNTTADPVAAAGVMLVEERRCGVERAASGQPTSISDHVSMSLCSLERHRPWGAAPMRLARVPGRGHPLQDYQLV